jgi:hypothetical protein
MQRSVEARYPRDKYDYIPGVPVFKTHTRLKSGKLVKVTRDDLEETAKTHNWLWDALGRASPFSEGHTLDSGPDGAEVPETDQPDVCGVGVKFYVDKWPTDPEEDYLFCTYVVPKTETERIKKTYGDGALSPEYYPSRKWLYPISLLKSSAPELEMPPIPFKYGLEEEPYQLPIPFHYTKETEPMNPMDEKEAEKEVETEKEAPEKEKKSPEEKAEKKESKGAKQDTSDLGEIKQMLTQLMPLVQNMDKIMALVQLMDEEEGGEDPMKPAGGPEKVDSKPVPADVEKGADSKPEEKDKAFDNPVKFDASVSSGTNGCVPGFNKDKKENYKVDKNDDVLKYKKELDAAKAELAKVKTEQQATAKVAKDLYKESRRTKAEKWVHELETVDLVQYQSEEAKQEDIEMLSGLDEDTAKIMLGRMKVRYQKKLPDATEVKNVAKYAVESEPDLGTKTPEEAHERAMQIIKSGMSVEQFYKNLKDGAAKK